MSRTRTLRRGVGLLAAAGLAAATLTVISAPAHAAGASIHVLTTGNLGNGQIIQVEGNAGAANASDLFVAMCEGAPTKNNCVTSLSGFGTPTAYILQVTPDPSTGAWGPFNFMVRTTLVTGNTPAGFNCLTAGTCLIGQTSQADPSNHSFDATQSLDLGPTVSLSSSTGVNGDVITVSGTGYPARSTTTGDALNTPLNVGLCGFPPSATNCDGTLSHYPSVNVDSNGHFSTSLTLNFPFTDFASTVHTCTAAGSCIVGTSNQQNPADLTNNGGALIQNIPAATLSVTSVTGQTVTTAARAGDTVNLTGGSWDASGAITAQLCDTSGANCDASGISSSTIATDGSGNLTGGAVIDASATTGARTLKVSQGAHVASASITILGTRAIVLTPSSGGPGTTVTVTGSNWDPSESIDVGGMTAVLGATSDPIKSGASANSSGAFTQTFVVNDPATAFIVAANHTDTTKHASAPFGTSLNECTVPDGDQCQLQQNVTFLAKHGVLKQSQSGSTVFLDADSSTPGVQDLQLDGTEQHVTGDLNTDTVTDARGTSAGWTLNAKVSDFTNGATPTTNGTIAATNLAWVPACAVTSGGATPTVGTSTTLSNSDQLLCSVPSGTGNGVYTADAGLTLTVPATADAGTYNAILTLTLS